MQPETWSITILNPGSGQFKLKLKSPKDTNTWASGAISCNVSAGDMRQGIANFFSTYYGSDIKVSLVMYDSNNVVTTTSSLSKKNVYTIKCKRSISGYSFTSS